MTGYGPPVREETVCRHTESAFTNQHYILISVCSPKKAQKTVFQDLYKTGMSLLAIYFWLDRKPLGKVEKLEVRGLKSEIIQDIRGMGKAWLLGCKQNQLVYEAVLQSDTREVSKRGV